MCLFKLEHFLTISNKLKLEKKIKYTEIQKEKAKKAAEYQKNKEEGLKTVMCNFFLQGRCTKGDSCSFKHDQSLVTAPEKKYEICKFYLNSFCAKGDKCNFMHSEFPCKFYHKYALSGSNAQPGLCTNADKCRFSHAPITDPLMLDAFARYMNEIGGLPANSQPSTSLPGQEASTYTLLSNPLLPPAAISSINPTSKPAKKAPLLATPPVSTTMLAPPLATAAFQDVDERIVPAPDAHLPLILPTGDIDERGATSSTLTNTVQISPRQPLLPSPPLLAVPVALNPKPQSLLPTPAMPKPSLLPLPKPVVDASIEEKYEAVKKELIIKIMKAVADDDGGIFSQIPKQTLTDLLVKLLNSNAHSTDLDLETIVALLATITAASTSNVVSGELQDADFRTNLPSNGYSNGNGFKPSTTPADINDLDDDDRYHLDYDRDIDHSDLIINGMLGDFPYRLIPIDVTPSSLWNTMAKTHAADAHFYLDNNQDQEIDPRIMYYSNRANMNIVGDFQNSLIQKEQQEALKQQQQEQQSNQQQQAPPTSPNSSKNANSTASVAKPAVKTVDPRLLKNTSIASASSVAASSGNQAHQSSPNTDFDSTQSVKAAIKQEETLAKSDLLALQTRQLSANSLLSSLPDINLPQDIQRSLNSYLSGAMKTESADSGNSSSIGTVKLSIADYKRKLQKPSGSSSNNLVGMASSEQTLTNGSAPVKSEPLNESKSELPHSSVPGLPSYTFNLQAPQSLHELLRNFQS
jgi:hypothetical protein